MSALILGPEQKQALAELKAKAEAAPLHMPTVAMLLHQHGGMDEHMQRMAGLTIQIPANYTVTFSIDDEVSDGQKARHLSMATGTPGKVPHIDAVTMIAKELGFQYIENNVLVSGAMWLEPLPDGQKAVNIVQYL